MTRRHAIVGAALALACAGAWPTGAEAATFRARVTNPWFPLHPGMRWVYRGVEERKRLRNVVRVADRVERIGDARCAVVIDKVYLDGRLREWTEDWYAQDRRGRVWYFGENTKELDRHGHVVSREGSWRDGVDGARAGIFMPHHPRRGQTFQQEHYPGHAEDRFEVLTRHASIRTPFRTFRRRALKTKEWTPLEPGVRDRKWYVRGIGQVAERTVRGGSDHAKLVRFRKRAREDSNL